MHRLYLILILMVFNLTVYCQFEEDFTNSDLSEWQGDTDSFQITPEKTLQLNASEAGQSLLFINTTFPDSLFWQFDAKLGFSPSNNNRLTILLAVDNSDLAVANGYILEIGENGSDDAIEVYALDNGSTTLVGRGLDTKVSSSFDITIRLEKDVNDIWTLNCGPSDGLNNFDLQFQNAFPENILTQMSIFGFLCQYTSSNTNNFTFDNIKIDAIRPDTDAPQVVQVNVLSENQIEVIFNEDIDGTSATNNANYNITNAALANIEFEDNNPNRVLLNLSSPLNSCDESILTIRNINDLFGNALTEFTEPLFFMEMPSPGDILINEILADPNTGGIDFVELVNPTTKSFALKDLIIRNADKNESETITEDIVLGPGEFIAFAKSSTEVNLEYNVPSNANIRNLDIPSFNIASGNISLIRSTILGEEIIDAFDYLDDYHDPSINPTKGISLERISYVVNTNDALNWSSSTLNEGATPGYANSIGEELQTQLTANILEEDQIEIKFLNTVSESSAIDINNYSLNNGATIIDVTINPDDNKTLILFLQSPLESGITYNLTVNNVTTDCGDIYAESQFELFRIDEPENGDLLINEILFDGEEEGDDFVEIINTTNKYISLKNVALRNNTRNDNDIFINGLPFILPNQIIALTEDVESVIDQYDPPAVANIFTQKVPAFNRDEGNVSIIYKGILEVSLDAFDYNEDFHFEALSDTKSVSLERISLISDSQDPSNWNSSAGTNNFATPGYENSVRSATPSVSDEVITFESKVFSPDGDGFKDLLIINYQFDKPGYIGKIAVYDDRGREEFILVENQLYGINGIIKWDGTLNNNVIAPMGIYILQYEFFHPDGDIKSGKKVCVLAQQLN